MAFGSILFFYVVMVFSCMIIILCQGNLYDFNSLSSSEFAIVQYDSRKLDNYWEVSALWNKKYADIHGHRFIYYSASTENVVTNTNGKPTPCYHLNDLNGQSENAVGLATPWCKVRSMIAATEEFLDVKVFIYLDSDAVISADQNSTSLQQYMTFMQHQLNWNVLEKPIIFNQDGPCWWCDLIQKVGYSTCLNSGTVAWVRNPRADIMLKAWWDSALDDYSENPLKRKFRTNWPWEQDRQMAVYHRYPQYIQLSSHPDRIHMPKDPGKHGSWCFSHLPTAKCFVAHYCANKNSKQVMSKVYRNKLSDNDSADHIKTYILKI